MTVIKRFNNAFGTTTDSPLSSTATTMNSAELPRLGVVDSTNNEIARLTLDPERADGAPEIIHVTDYDGSATSATIERGKEGTTAREHPSGTTWEHGPTREDVNAGDDGGKANAIAVGPDAVIESGSNPGESVAVGYSAFVSDFGYRSVAVGYNARVESGGLGNVALGKDTSVDGNDGVAIGLGAICQNDGQTVVGSGADGGISGSTVAIGSVSSAGNDHSVAVGHTASSPWRGVALGADADASTEGAVALGYATTAGHDNAVALGRGVSTTASDQVHIGTSHLALDEIADPATPGADEARLYVRDDGSGTTELVVLFDSGNETVIATGAA